MLDYYFSYLIAWMWAFAFTQVIEVPVYQWYLGCSLPRAFAASSLTHPMIWFAFLYVRGHYPLAVVAAELFAWLAEALFFARPFGLQRALRASLVANAASLALGLLSRAAFGIP